MGEIRLGEGGDKTRGGYHHHRTLILITALSHIHSPLQTLTAAEEMAHQSHGLVAAGPGSGGCGKVSVRSRRGCLVASRRPAISHVSWPPRHLHTPQYTRTHPSAMVATFRKVLTVPAPCESQRTHKTPHPTRHLLKTYHVPEMAMVPSGRFPSATKSGEGITSQGQAPCFWYDINLSIVNITQV